jgi:hypothetical protein
MPVRSQHTTRAQRLTAALTERLYGPLSLDEPFVIEDRVPQTRSRHAVVIWDAWKDLSREERSNIILDAYSSSNRLRGDTVRVAMGLTQEEAFDIGYLPFQIVSTIRNADPIDRDAARRALDSVGGIHVRVGSSEQVRFPSQEYAQEAYRQLTSKFPGPYWAITQEVPTISRA